MSLPVRCFTCNKCIGHLEEKFEKMLEEGVEMKKILDTFGLQRYCCRRMFLGYVNIDDKVRLYGKMVDNTLSPKSKTDNN